MTQLDNVTVIPTANVYFEGKCISYNLHTADGRRKSTGVIFPASLTFTTSAPEVMEVVKGRCRVKLPGTDEWREYQDGGEFRVAGDSSFDIEILETLHYICHYG
jgi:uncharacterized protein YaiE (UPF0345 family)